MDAVAEMRKVADQQKLTLYKEVLVNIVEVQKQTVDKPESVVGEDILDKAKEGVVRKYTPDGSKIDSTRDPSSGKETKRVETKADNSSITTTPTAAGGTLAVHKDKDGKVTKRVETTTKTNKDGSTITEANGKRALIIPASVGSIGKDAFKDQRLTSVTIPASLGGSIDQTAFAGNSTLEKVTITGTGAIKDSAFIYTQNSGNAFKGIFAESGSSGIALVIEDGITLIGEGAFKSSELTSVTIPASVTSIAGGAFASNKLTSVTIPNSVTSIGGAAFQLNNLTSVTIGTSVTSIGRRAFAGNELTSVEIPDSVTSIGNQAFRSNKLDLVEIPDSVTSIGEGAFYQNELTSVTIGTSVKTIGKAAFTDNKLTSG